MIVRIGRPTAMSHKYGLKLCSDVKLQVELLAAINVVKHSDNKTVRPVMLPCCPFPATHDKALGYHAAAGHTTAIGKDERS